MCKQPRCHRFNPYTSLHSLNRVYLEGLVSGHILESDVMRFINADFHTTHNLLVCAVEEILSVRSAPDRGLVGHVKRIKGPAFVWDLHEASCRKAILMWDYLGYVAGNTFFSNTGCAKE